MIVNKFRSFLYGIDEIQNQNVFEPGDLINNISKAISMIQKNIEPRDQFATQMDLVKEGKLRSEDIAKLISLRGKTHFDILRERIFLQNKPYWFFKNYPKEIEELEKEFLKIVERERMGERMAFRSNNDR